jgi:hypothetical protein
MSPYEKCCGCSGWINTLHSDFQGFVMRDGQTHYAHNGACANRFHEAHDVDIVKYQAHINVRIGGKHDAFHA